MKGSSSLPADLLVSLYRVPVVLAPADQHAVPHDPLLIIYPLLSRIASYATKLLET